MNRALTFIVCLGFFCSWGKSAGESASQARGEEKRDEERFRYANRPDALYPYANVTIYKDNYATVQQFFGAGREKAEPSVKSVRIGFIGPLLKEDAPLLQPHLRPAATLGPKALFGRHMLRGAMLALEEANRSGGYEGKDFELVRRTDLVLWGQTSNELVQFVYEDHVWAILSSIDSNHNHVLNRAALKAQVPVVNAGSTDPTLTEHNIPWLIRCISDDRLHSYELLNQIYRIKGHKRVALLRVNDRDGRVGVAEFIKGARRLGNPVLMELRFDNGDSDFADQLRIIQQLQADAVVLWANPPEAGLIVKAMRKMGMQQEVFGFDRLAHPSFLQAADGAAEHVVVAASLNPDREEPRWRSFQQRYRQRFGQDPDTYAAHAYDGMQLIIDAVRSAGLNRVRIRDALYALKTYRGAAGEIVFDRTMNDMGRAWLAVVRNGRFHYFRPPDWEREEHLQVHIGNPSPD